jgi:hypothetical protein
MAEAASAVLSTPPVPNRFDALDKELPITRVADVLIGEVLRDIEAYIGASKLRSFTQCVPIRKQSFAISTSTLDGFRKERDVLDDPLGAAEGSLPGGTAMGASRWDRDELRTHTPCTNNRSNLRLRLRSLYGALEVNAPERLHAPIRNDLHVVGRTSIRLELIVGTAMRFEAPSDRPSRANFGWRYALRWLSVEHQIFGDLADWQPR